MLFCTSASDLAACFLHGKEGQSGGHRSERTADGEFAFDVDYAQPWLCYRKRMFINRVSGEASGTVTLFPKAMSAESEAVWCDFLRAIKYLCEALNLCIQHNNDPHQKFYLDGGKLVHREKGAASGTPIWHSFPLRECNSLQIEYAPNYFLTKNA